MINLGSHEDDGIRYRVHLSSPGGALAQMVQHPDGNWVPYDEYTKVSKELDEMRELNHTLAHQGLMVFDENERLRKVMEEAIRLLKEDTK